LSHFRWGSINAGGGKGGSARKRGGTFSGGVTKKKKKRVALKEKGGEGFIKRKTPRVTPLKGRKGKKNFLCERKKGRPKRKVIEISWKRKGGGGGGGEMNLFAEGEEPKNRKEKG